MSSNQKKNTGNGKDKNKNKSNQKDASNVDQEVSEQKDTIISIADVQILRYNQHGSPNLLEFKREISTYGKRTHGDLGTIIDTGKHKAFSKPIKPKRPEPRLGEIGVDEIELEDYRTDVALYVNHVKKYEDELRDYKKQYVRFSADIWSLLSEQSKDRLKQEDTFIDVYEGNDPLELWKLIEQTHSTSRIMKISPAEAKADVRDEYNRFHQTKK
jgi:hypothetical protein